MSDENDLLKTLTSLLASESEPEEKEKVQEESNDATPFDLETILKLGSMFSDFSTDDERAILLRDLKPFLTPERRSRVDQTIKILKLLKIAEKAKNENLF